MHVQGSQSQLVVPPPSEPWPSPASYLHLYGKAYRLPLTAYRIRLRYISNIPASNHSTANCTGSPPTFTFTFTPRSPARTPRSSPSLPRAWGPSDRRHGFSYAELPPPAPATPCHARMLSFCSQAIHSKCASRKDNRRRARRRAEGERRHSRQLQGGEPRLQREVRWVQPGRTRGTR